MNLLGHPYVAWKTYHPITWYHVAGSFLPDLVPFVTTTLFTFEEFHEGGEQFYQFLKTNYPDAIGLAEGMLAHGVQYGADKYSRMLEEKYQLYRNDLAERIVEATPNLSLEMADKARFHNFLWWGVDVQILNNETEFLMEFRKLLKQIDLDQMADLVSIGFSKDRAVVKELLLHLDPIFQNGFVSVTDLAQLWKVIAAGLPERDEVNVEITAKLFEDIAEIEKNDWREILDTVIDGVGSNLKAAGFRK